MSNKKLKRRLSMCLALSLAASVPGVSMTNVAAMEELPPAVLHVTFDDGDAADTSQNMNDGTVVGDPEFVEGKSGSAIRLVNSSNRNDDAKQYVNFGQPEDLQFGDGDFTVMLWYKADAGIDTEGAIVSNKYWVSGGNQGFTIGDMREGVTLNLTGESGGRKDTGRYPAATDNAWHHVSAVIDRSSTKTMKLFIDGKLKQSVDISGISGSVDVADFLLGASNKAGSDEKFLAVEDACIDELQVYKEALSQEQIWTMGILPVENIVQDAVVSVSFDDENALDESGYGNDGTVVGEPEFGKGVRGKAIHLVNSTDRNDIAEQYVNFGQPEDLQFDHHGFSVMFWYKADAGIDTEGAIVSNKDWTTGANPGFTIGDMREGVTFNMNTAGCSRIDTGRYSMATDGTWHHVAAVADRDFEDVMKLYVDGMKVDQKNISNLTGSIDVSDFLIGASNNSNGTKDLAVADAWIDEFSVYKKALSDDEILDDFARNRPAVEADRIASELEMVTAGERFPQEAIDEMKAACQSAKEALQDPENDPALVYENLRAQYEAFVEGTPAKMTFHLMSDSHITDTTNSKADMFVKALKDMKAIGMDNSAFLIAGDLTEYGQDGEMDAFYSLFDANIPVDPDKAMIALGNHDMRGNWGWEDYPSDINHHYPVIEASYKKHNAKYMPEGCDTMYYDQWINGYHFLVLNSENSPKDVAYLSDAQLAWMEEEIAENADPSKPVFVLVHQALDDTHRGAMIYNGFGEQDAKVKEILAKYPQTVFISGHIHNQFGTAEVMDAPFGTLIDTPVFKDQGYGYEVYVYDTELYLRARNFANSTWLPQYDIDVQLDTLPSLVKQADSLVKEDYTADSWTTAKPQIDEARIKAEDCLALTYGNYGKDKRFEINKIQKELKSAMALLEEKGEEPIEPQKADKTHLNKAIAYAENQAENGALDHLNEVIKEQFAARLAHAKAVSADPDADQTAVDAAWKALVEVIQMLDFKADKQALEQAIAAAQAVDGDAYEHDQAWDSFKEALTEAQEVMEDSAALQERIDRACKALEEAQSALHPKSEEVIVDKTLLKQAIDYARAQDTEHLNKIVKEKFEAALDEAVRVFEEENASQDDVNKAWQNLVKMVQMLDFKSDKTDLKKTIADCADLNEEDYLQDDAWSAYEKALETARKVLESDTALQKEIDEANEALKAAVENLNRNTADEYDLSLLNAAIRKAEKLKLDRFKNGEAKTAFEDALAQARKTAESPQSQEQINQAARNLSNAMIRLRLMASKTLLDDLK